MLLILMYERHDGRQTIVIIIVCVMLTCSTRKTNNQRRYHKKTEGHRERNEKVGKEKVVYSYTSPLRRRYALVSTYIKPMMCVDDVN
jgi:hypothetical protein